MIKIMRASFVVVFVICVVWGSASAALGHGSSFSYEEVKDGYTIDIGHDEFIAAMESVRFDFAAYPLDLDAVEGEVYTDVWVTITKENQIFFAGGVDRPVFGATGFTYAFPGEGEYTLSARFQKDGDTVVGTEFPLSIIAPLEEKKELPPAVFPLLTGLAGLLLGFALALFIPHKLKNS
jgi:hypothetical protein